MELNFAPPDRVKSFRCSSCPDETKKLRRCADSREDFTHKDHAGVFPIMVTKEGEQFSFCPGKATWDPSIVSVYNSLVIAAETGALWSRGGISDQPGWFIDLLSLFLVRYNDHKFWSRARAIMGDASKSSTVKKQFPEAVARKGVK